MAAQTLCPKCGTENTAESSDPDGMINCVKCKTEYAPGPLDQATRIDSMPSAGAVTQQGTVFPSSQPTMIGQALCPKCGTENTIDSSAQDGMFNCVKCETKYETGPLDQVTRLDPVSSAAVVTGQGRVIPSSHPSPGRDKQAILQPGQTLGRCVVESELGRGGMGAVYLARHSTLDVPVALKVLLPQVALTHPAFAERFIREAKLAAKVNQANVVNVMDAAEDPDTGLFYIVQEFVDGGSVQDLIRKGPLPVEHALAITRDVTKALVAAARMNIIHRDIKPDNIMLTRDGDAKLADLGLAKQEDDSDGPGLTKSQAIMGTPGFMSQEQVSDSKSVDIRADIYSLGATLFQMLTTKLPFSGKTTLAVLQKIATEPTPDPRSKRHELPEAVALLCMKMMAKKAEDRHQTPQELLTALDKVILSPGTGQTVTAVQNVKKVKSSKSLMVAAIVILLIAAIGAYHLLPKGEKPIQTPLQNPPQTSETQPDSTTLTPPSPPASVPRTPEQTPGQIAARKIRMILADAKQHRARGNLALSKQILESGLTIDSENNDLTSGIAEINKVIKAKAEELRAFKAALESARLLEAKAKTPQDWTDVAQAYRQALPHTTDKEAVNTLIDKAEKQKIATADQSLQHNNKQFSDLMSKGERCLLIEDWHNARSQFDKALALDGYAENERAKEGVARAEAGLETHLRSLAYGKKMIAARRLAEQKNWKEAVLAYQAAIAVPGYEKDEKALAALNVVQEEAAAALASGASLIVEVTGFKKFEAKALCGLWNNPVGFPFGFDKLFKGGHTEVKGKTVTFIFKNIPPGSYAVAAFQDLDNSEKLETSMLGIPKEPWGVSNNIPGTFGAPSFLKTKFTLGKEDKTITITLNH